MALTPEEIKRLREIEEQRRNRVVALLGDTGEVKVDPSSPFSSVLLGSPEPAPVPTPHPEPVAPQLDPVTTSSVSAPAPTPEEAKRGGIGGWWDGLGQDGQGRLGSALMAMSGGILGSNNGQDVWSALGGGMTAAANSLDGSEKDATQIELNKQHLRANQMSFDASAKKDRVQAEIAKIINEAGPNWMADASVKNRVAALYNEIGEYDAATKLVGGQGNLADTADMKEYRFYVEQENAGGRTPMSFGDWQVKKADGSTRTTDVQVNLDRINREREGKGLPVLSMEDYQKQQNQAASDTKFAEKAGEKTADMFKSLSEDGFNARGDIDNIETLAGALEQTPGGFSNLVIGAANQWGIGDMVSNNASSVQLAAAMINKLVPQQRPAGSGAMSDADLELFKQSLPQLQGTPEGNAMIIDAMRGLAGYKRDMGTIAQRAMAGEITQSEAMEQMRNLPDPLASFKAKQKDLVQRDNNANTSLKVKETPAAVPQGAIRLPDGRVVRPRQGGR
ncbi:hypothetical protein [Agrobacterium tumefaciens]|uniref:hypothetical protein n=1 Tax=Agrobacterium tumefaciens TaxID=358 RepID=UPI0021D3007B|nr:hypothetical protein [Agrobacterium tumefaciens]UXS04532.1 hypothetical protein FY156_24025 [Agrobacterium tumefaciens]